MSKYIKKLMAATGGLLGGGLLFLAALVTASLIVVLGVKLFYEPSEVEKTERPKNFSKENPVHGYGYIDFEQVLVKHPEGENLKQLIGKEIRLKLELNELMRPISPPKLPEFDTTPFETSAREKIMQSLMTQLSELRARKKRLAEEYKQQTEGEYIKRRNANRDLFMNETFNITLKLQNAKTLHLTQEQIEQYQQRLSDLTFERNTKQKELLDAWTQEINDYVETQVADETARIRREIKETEQRYGEEAQKKLHEAQERNKALMAAAMQEVAVRQTRRQEILDEIFQTQKERTQLEDKILESIANEVGKLGALYKVEMVFIKREPSYAEEKLLENVEMIFSLNAPKVPGVMIYEGVDTKDLTQDLLKTIY